MKVVLITNVKGLGLIDDVVSAKDGYALNHLIPKRLAIPATENAIREADLRRKQAKDRRDINAKLFEQNIAFLAGARVVVKVKANEKGHLYDSIGELEIIKAVKECTNIILPESSVKLEKPIKELGTFDVPVSVHELFGTFKIIVETESD